MPSTRDTILDLAGIERVDRAGLARLLHEARRFWQAGKGFCLAHPSSALQATLAITRLNRLFEMAESIEEAEKQLALSVELHRARPMVVEDKVLYMTMPPRLIAANATECGQIVASEWERYPPRHRSPAGFRSHPLYG